MSDRTAAEIFGRIFKRLAKEPKPRSEAIEKLARDIWKMTKDYDFEEGRQLFCDRELQSLGLARKSDDKLYPMEYGPERKKKPKDADG